MVETLESRQLLTTFTVTTLNDVVNAGDGVTSLREAITAANNSSGADTIQFANGLNGTISLALGQMSITDSLTITGNGSSNTTIDAHQASRIFRLSGGASAVTLNGLTLTNGRTTGNDYSDGGAAIFSAVAGALTINNSVITGNSTTGTGSEGHAPSGGAIHLDYATNLSIFNSQITNNSTSGNFARGGAIYNFQNVSTLTLTSTTLTGNSTTGNNADGGAIFWFAGSVALNNNLTQLRDNSTQGTNSTGGALSSKVASITVSGAVIASNSTSGDGAKGGGIYSISGAVKVLSASTVTDNHTHGTDAPGGGIATKTADVTITIADMTLNGTTNSNAPGGAIYSDSGDVTVQKSTISGNLTQGNFSHGGAIAADGGAVSIQASTISGNSTAGTSAWGGGIRAADGSLTLVNSTISGNQSTGTDSAGGGLSVDSAPLTLTNCTVALNTSVGTTFLGGGLFASTGNVTLNNTIIAQNTNAGAPDLSPGSGTLVINHSLIGTSLGTGLTPSATPDAQGNLIGSDLVPLDPQLGPLQDNGGLTHTHALLGGPALNGGSNVLATSANLSTDQRGLPRISGSIVDMGAVEFQLSVANFEVSEVSYTETAGTQSITVNLSVASAVDVIIPFTVTGTATDPSDFTIDASPLVIPAGQTSGTILIHLVDAPGYEPAETVVLTFGTLPNAAAGGITSTTITILDVDNGPPILDASTTPASFIKKQKQPVAVLTDVVVGDSDSPDNLGGGKLLLTVNVVTKKNKVFDSFSLPGLGNVGTSSGPFINNGQLTLEIQLKGDVTPGAIQDFLEGIKFTTKGKGLKTSTRTLKVQLVDVADASTEIERTINVRKK